MATSSVITVSTPAASTVASTVGVRHRPGGHGQAGGVGGGHGLRGHQADRQVDGGAAEVHRTGDRRVRVERGDHQEPGGAGRTGGPHGGQRPRPERGDDDRLPGSAAGPDQVDHGGRTGRTGSKAGSVGRFLTSMFTTMPAQASSASASSGTWSGRSAAASSWTGPTPSITGSWCTASPPSAVSRTSSSTPSAPSDRARAKAASVFSPIPVAGSGLPRWACTAVGPLTLRTPPDT